MTFSERIYEWDWYWLYFPPRGTQPVGENKKVIFASSTTFIVYNRDLSVIDSERHQTTCPHVCIIFSALRCDLYRHLKYMFAINCETTRQLNIIHWNLSNIAHRKSHRLGNIFIFAQNHLHGTATIADSRRRTLECSLVIKPIWSQRVAHWWSLRSSVDCHSNPERIGGIHMEKITVYFDRWIVSRRPAINKKPMIVQFLRKQGESVMRSFLALVVKSYQIQVAPRQSCNVSCAPPVVYKIGIWKTSRYGQVDDTTSEFFSPVLTNSIVERMIRVKTMRSAATVSRRSFSCWDERL